jgi:hypothetical protein
LNQAFLLDKKRPLADRNSNESHIEQAEVNLSNCAAGLGLGCEAGFRDRSFPNQSPTFHPLFVTFYKNVICIAAKLAGVLFVVDRFVHECCLAARFIENLSPTNGLFENQSTSGELAKHLSMFLRGKLFYSPEWCG